MVSEEEKLDKLCMLLDRLDSKYSSAQNSPSKSLPKDDSSSSNTTAQTSSDKKSQQNLTKQSPKKNSPKSSNTKNNVNPVNCNSPKTKDETPISGEGSTLSQEDKKNLRKMKKEAKKQGKSQPSTSAPTTEITSPSIPVKKEEAKVDIEKTEEKSKADLKRERREKQEAQRAAKVQAKVEEEQKIIKKSEPVVEKPTKTKKVVRKSCPILDKKFQILSHLRPQQPEIFPSIKENRYIHPALQEVGYQMTSNVIDNCNARVVATLAAICELIEDYSTPKDKEFARDFGDLLSYNINYLNGLQPIIESMNNALGLIKREVNALKNNVTEEEAKKTIIDSIESFIHNKIVLASETIMTNALNCIDDQEVIITFGGSNLVLKTIKEAATQKQHRSNVTLIVVDTPYPGSGKHMVKELAHIENITVYYRTFTDLDHVLQMATMVMVEAEAVYLNGAMIAPAGVSSLAIEAFNRNIPMTVLLQSYKLCSTTVHDSLNFNQLGNPVEVLSDYNSESEDVGSCLLNAINLTFDITPPELIRFLITEIDTFPPTRVPSILKNN